MTKLRFLLAIAFGHLHISVGLAHDLSALGGPVQTWFAPPRAAPPPSDGTATADSVSCANGALMATSFAPFKPKVRYYWDDAYFYEESDGMPDTALMPNLMVGITAWQQQIPLPASYFAGTTNPEGNVGSLGYHQPNVWRLPLVPVPSGTNSIVISAGNFQRGAIAVAANGIPIFNPRNNRGEFSYAIGELDQYGGHCGLADDYHYHIVPVHLQSVLGTNKPAAWAMDGYSIYGYTEPDGTTRQSLDADGGHDVGSGWGYHYHAIGSAATGPQNPYMMNAFHGTVVNFGGQVDPQPEVSPLRASGTGGYAAQPVAGAAIIAFKNPVALTNDALGNFIESLTGTPSNDQYLMRYTVGATSYDLCWRLNRNVNPKTLTITWRLPTISPTTTTYNNGNNRLTTYPMAAPSLAKLPDTGQTLDATGIFGEDSDYTLNAPSFSDNGNGTITDNVTGLMWQKTDSGEGIWDSAVTNAASLTDGGYTDWRLPTPTELFSILNHNNNPALNSIYFVNNPSGTPDYWWTSDIYGSDATKVWCANAGGGLGPKPKSETLSAGGSFRYYARYVRGAKATNGHNHLNNCDGTITDLDTGLMWSQVPSSSLSWSGALAYAENLTLAGYTDWRLPNVKELQTLVDFTLATATTTNGILPCLNRTLFPTATATAYWSSTSVKAGTPTQAWLVEFGINNSVPVASGPTRGSQGIVSYELYGSTYPVFAVRTAGTNSASTRSISQGRAAMVITNLYPAGQRVTGVGSSTATNGTIWTVPSATQFATATKASDLYNETTGVTPTNIAAVNLNAVPVVEVDPDGEVITGYLFADNYFELYVNGTLVGVDPVPYTPFNSCVVKFKAKRPITYAVKLVDWEENLGLGTELNGANPYHAGDGGFMASFSDGTVTDNRWKAQSFYIAPLDNPNLVVEMPDGTHNSSAASTTPTLGTNCYALHYSVPANWFAKTFNDAGWPPAATYAEATVGVDNKPAYLNFPAQFSASGAQFIWSSNLVLDNEVIVRYTGPAAVTQIAVEQPAGTALTDGVSTVSFGNVNLGAGAAKTFTIRNNGTNTLAITGTTIDGANATNFSVTTPPAGSLAAGSNTTLVVSFNETTAGTRVATLHITSSDGSVGAAFDIGLQGIGIIPPPTITNTATSPNTPTYVDGVYVTARIQPAAATTITQAQLTYSAGGLTTNTVFTETMAAAAATPWTGTNANNLWTVTALGPANTFKQTTAANHGTGNPCGLEFDKGTVNLSDSLVATANAINAAGSAGYVEFWVATAGMISPNGWAFQVSIDSGATWTTRLSELTGLNHAYQFYHYDLLPSERVSTLKLRFQFAGYNAVAPTPAPKADLDDLKVVTTTGSPPVSLAMVDDGLHGDGLAGDGIYGAQIAVLPAGTAVTYFITATDSNGGVTTSAAAGSYIVNSTTPSTNLTVTVAISGGSTTLQWNAQAGLIYSVLWSDDLLTWNNFPVGQTNTWTDVDSSGLATKRFYRVMR